MAERLDQDEFEKLVAELRGHCDKCSHDCRDRLRWMDSLIESLHYQLAKSLAMNRVLLKAAKLVAEDDYLDREINKLTTRILRKEATEKGPLDDSEGKDIDKVFNRSWN